jgi:hypothetical protein
MNYSDYWRVNKSVIEHVELANALGALRKVANYLKVDAEVNWRGMHCSPGKNKIELSPFLARGQYPIPAENMDVLVGLDIHQALHIVENSQQVWDHLLQMFPSMEDKTILDELASAGEDIHIDGVAIKKGLPGKYVQKARAWWSQNHPSDLDFMFGLPTPQGLFEAWRSIALNRIFPGRSSEQLETLKQLPLEETPDVYSLVGLLCLGDSLRIFQIERILLSMTRDYLEPLRLLLSKTGEIVEADPIGRALCYRELWIRLEKQFLDWQAKKIEAAESSEEGVGSQASLVSGEEELPSRLASRVRLLMNIEAEDITAEIEAAWKVQGKERPHHFPVIFENATKPAHRTPDLELVRILRETIRLVQEKASRINHGLWSGKLDARRLYRVPTTGRVFKQKEYFLEDYQWDITLLADASGSMERWWGLVESTYAALVKALGGRNIKLEALAYNFIVPTETCQITRLFYNNSLFTLTPSGNTPTGEGILAAALKMPQGNRRLILHITDGLWNIGVDTWYALEFCKEQKIDLVTLGCGSAEKSLELQYGDSYEKMDSLQELPKAVGALLKRKLLGKG